MSTPTAGGPGTAAVMLAASGLAVTFADDTRRRPDTVALDDVSVEVRAGEVLGILGASGSGKSTLLRAIAGLEMLSAGRVLWDGMDITAVPVHRRGFALMFQDGQLFPHRTVGSNIAYPLRIARQPRGQMQERVTELLDLVGLTGFEDRAVTELSGGEQQRVALARALAARPRLLLLDEPLSALDRELRDRLATDLRRILVETGTTAIMVTHDQDEAFAMSDRVAVMGAGHVLQTGSPIDLWRAPATEAIARFLGYTTVLDESRARVLLPHAIGRVALRPAAIIVDRAGEVTARVIATAPSVAGSRLRLAIGGVGEVDGVSLSDLSVAPGAEVLVRVDAAATAALPAQLAAQK